MKNKHIHLYEDLPDIGLVKKLFDNLAQDGSSNKEMSISNHYTKTTFSLSDKLLDRLETAWLTSRKAKMLPDRKITKTEIVEAALDVMLTDFESHLELSKIIQKIKK